MLLGKQESYLGQILQELLLMELTEKEKKRGKKNKLEREDTGKFPAFVNLCFWFWMISPHNWKALVRTYLKELTLEYFREKSRFLLQIILEWNPYLDTWKKVFKCSSGVSKSWCSFSLSGFLSFLLTYWADHKCILFLTTLVCSNLSAKLLFWQSQICMQWAFTEWKNGWAKLNIWLIIKSYTFQSCRSQSLFTSSAECMPLPTGLNKDDKTES